MTIITFTFPLHYISIFILVSFHISHFLLFNICCGYYYYNYFIFSHYFYFLSFYFLFIQTWEQKIHFLYQREACRCLLWDNTGMIKRSFAAFLGTCLVAVAELWGMFYALQMAWPVDLRQVTLEVDSAAALQLVENPLTRKLLFASVISKAQELLHKDWIGKLSPIFREVNRTTDGFANNCHSLELGEDGHEVGFPGLSSHLICVFSFALGFCPPSIQKE